MFEDAAEAHSDLYVFDAVVSILDGGHIHAPSYAAAQRIIAISKRHQDVCLRRYDRYLAAALKENA